GTAGTTSYDSRGNTTSAVDALGNRVTMTYDSIFDQPTSFQDPLGNSLAFSRDARGNQTQTIYPDNTSEQYSYDPAGNIVQAVNRRSQATHLTYDVHNLLVHRDYADG